MFVFIYLRYYKLLETLWQYTKLSYRFHYQPLTLVFTHISTLIYGTEKITCFVYLLPQSYCWARVFSLKLTLRALRLFYIQRLNNGTYSFLLNAKLEITVQGCALIRLSLTTVWCTSVVCQIEGMSRTNNQFSLVNVSVTTWSLLTIAVVSSCWSIVALLQRFSSEIKVSVML